MQKKIDGILTQEGYRRYRIPDKELCVYYKYVKFDFWVVLTVDLERSHLITPVWHRETINKIQEIFYHPGNYLTDFPGDFPVYHVEALTLLSGGAEAQVKELCRECENVWAYNSSESRVMVYENQPEDFGELRKALENIPSSRAAGARIKMLLRDRIKGIGKLSYVTIALAAANVIIYLILEILGNTENAVFIAEHGGMYPEYILYENQWWRILTACFIHFGAAHLINNMVIFCCVGSRLEHAAGHTRMLVIYLLSGIGGGLLSYAAMIQTGEYAVAAGASGAVFGTIGGLLWAVILHRGQFEGLTTRGLVLMAALSLYYGFSTIGVDNWGHVGGIITGFVTTMILYHRKYQKY